MLRLSGADAKQRALVSSMTDEELANVTINDLWNTYAENNRNNELEIQRRRVKMEKERVKDATKKVLNVRFTSKLYCYFIQLLR